MVDNAPAKAAAAEKIFTPQGKVIDANVMKSIAEEAQIEALVLVMVDDLDSYMVNRFLASMMILTILTLKLLPMRIFMYTGTTATGSPKKKFMSVT